MSVLLTPASALDFDHLVKAFNAGYEGYIVPINLNAEQMRHHIDANSIDLDSSWVAWLGSDIIGFGLLGRRESLGWIGGIGVVPTHRGQGVGRQLMTGILDRAKRTSVTRVYLEVIIGNGAAYKLYQSLGFETLRRLLIIGCEPTTSTESTGIRVEKCTLSDIFLLQANSTRKPWQRQPAVHTGSVWGAFRNGELRAYVIGQIAPKRIVFNDAGGEDDALQAIIAHLHDAHPDIGGTFVNLAEDDPIWPVFAGLGYTERMAQYEMAINLT